MLPTPTPPRHATQRTSLASRRHLPDREDAITTRSTTTSRARLDGDRSPRRPVPVVIRHSQPDRFPFHPRAPDDSPARSDSGEETATTPPRPRQTAAENRGTGRTKRRRRRCVPPLTPADTGGGNGRRAAGAASVRDGRGQPFLVEISKVPTQNSEKGKLIHTVHRTGEKKTHANVPYMQVRSNPSRCSELPAFAASAAGRSAMSRSRTRKEASTVQGRQLSQETLLHKRRRNVSTPYGIAKTAQTPCRSSQSDDNASAAVTMFRSGFGQRCQEYVSHKVDWPFSIFDFYTPIRSFFSLFF